MACGLSAKALMVAAFAAGTMGALSGTHAAGLGPGIFLEEMPERAKSFTVLRVDPKHYELKLLTASGLNLPANLSVKEWVRTQKLAGAINAGMYQTDYKTSVGMLVADGKSNNGSIRKNYKAVLAFEPVKAGIPAVQIIDRDCQNFDELRSQYRSLLQSIRMVTCSQSNTWKAGGEAWPIAALGATKKGDVLFVFARQPITPHDFTNTVLGLPLDLHNMMYLEGGPPAQFYAKVGTTEIDLTGSYTDGTLPLRTTVPNVLGFVKKPQPTMSSPPSTRTTLPVNQ